MSPKMSQKSSQNGAKIQPKSSPEMDREFWKNTFSPGPPPELQKAPKRPPKWSPNGAPGHPFHPKMEPVSPKWVQNDDFWYRKSILGKLWRSERKQRALSWKTVTFGTQKSLKYVGFTRFPWKTRFPPRTAFLIQNLSKSDQKRSQNGDQNH